MYGKYAKETEKAILDLRDQETALVVSEIQTEELEKAEGNIPLVVGEEEPK